MRGGNGESNSTTRRQTLVSEFDATDTVAQEERGTRYESSMPSALCHRKLAGTGAISAGDPTVRNAPILGL